MIYMRYLFIRLAIQATFVPSELALERERRVWGAGIKWQRQTFKYLTPLAPQID